MFNRYEGRMHFGSHVDGAIRLHPATGAKLRTDVSATLFLSSSDEYDGEALLVEDTYGVHSLVKDDARRSLLFDLDTAVQRLTSGDADRTTLTNLTGAHHNLLRM